MIFFSSRYFNPPSLSQANQNGGKKLILDSPSPAFI